MTARTAAQVRSSRRVRRSSAGQVCHGRRQTAKISAAEGDPQPGDCFLLKVHGPSIESLEALLDAFLLFGQTTTAVVVATPVAPRSPVVTDGS
jgi:hypothetical protein